MKIFEIYKESFKTIFALVHTDGFKFVGSVFLFAVLFLAAIIVPLFLTNKVLLWIGMVLCCHVILLPVYIKLCRIIDKS